MALPVDPKAIPTVVNRFGTTTLAANLNQNTTTSCTLSDASGLPDGSIGGCIQIEDEIIYFESRVGNVLSTLRRGRDGTTAVSHDAGVIVTSRIVAGNFNSLKGAVLDLDAEKYELPAGGTADQFIDGTGSLQDIPAYQDSDTVIIPVRNTTGATIPKASVVYVSGESGGKILINLADADSEVQSAKTIGLTRNEILNNSDGFVVIIGAIDGVNTQGMTAGAELWLSQTPGAYTTTKPVSPAHLVQVGFVKIAGNSTTNGSLEVRIDNGYEIAELHDVLINNPTANQVLKWNGSDLWTNETLQISDTDGLQTALDSKVDENAAITGATKTKITYDSKGLVTAGDDAAISDITGLQTALDSKVDENAAITGATKTKITYDAKGLVTAGADAAIADITGLQTALDSKVDENAAITGATKTKITYDAKGLVTAGADAAIADITGLQTALDSKVDENAAITGATKTKITYDSKGLVTAGADATTDDIAEGATNKYYPASDAAKLSGIEPGAEVNNISDIDATDLTDGGNSSLHFHSSDRDRTNHTGTQTAATISDFDTEVANNTAVAANTAKVSADGSINTHSDVDTSTTAPVSGQALVWNGTTWVPDDVVVDPAGANTQIQFNNNGAFGASANLTFDGALNVKGAGSTNATQTLSLTNSAAINLFTMNDDGTFNGVNLGIGEYTGAIRIGENAAPSATGIYWTAIGYAAGRGNTSGNSWAAIGLSAGLNNTTGSFWTAIGTNAGRINTTGSDWTAIGYTAGRSNTTGSEWTAIGVNAGRNNTTGSRWTAIGTSAGRYIKGTTTALEYFQNSTYIGTDAKGTNGTSSVLTDNETVIGYAAEGNGSNTVTIGSSAVTANYFSGRIETTSTGTTSATQALKLTNSSAVSLLTMNDDGTFNGKNIAIGEYVNSIRMGEFAADNATGSAWTAIGSAAANSSTTGTEWTAIGRSAGRNNTTGSFWTAIGSNSGLTNVTGSSWTAIGYEAGQVNSSSNFWTAIGRSAAVSNDTGNSWTALGSYSGQNNTTGSEWTAVGMAAGAANLTGSGWTALGRNAGRYIKGSTTPLEYFQNSTYIGKNTKGTNGTSSVLTDNETVIGYAAEGNGSNTVTIGSSAVTDNYFTGDIHAQGSGNGIIVTSPDGLTTLRIGIDNSGNIVTSTP